MEVPAGSPQDSEQALFDEDSDICINIILIRMFLQDQFIHDNLNRNLALALQLTVNGAVDDILLHQIENFRIFFKREGLDILSAAVADGSSYLADTAAGDIEAVEVGLFFQEAVCFPVGDLGILKAFYGSDDLNSRESFPEKITKAFLTDFDKIGIIF